VDQAPEIKAQRRTRRLAWRSCRPGVLIDGPLNGRRSPSFRKRAAPAVGREVAGFQAAASHSEGVFRAICYLPNKSRIFKGNAREDPLIEREA
jgi:hypothetical protein